VAHGRFAPSPTGRLHLGNLRTALLAWLFARAAGSEFTLRIEDLDPQRSRAEHEEQQLADLRAIGLDWDGTPQRQSTRADLHREAVARLEESGRVYPCFCSRAEIRAATHAPHGDLPEGAYPGTCRDLTPTEREQRRRETGRAPALRLDARAERIGFTDRLRGPVEGVVDDFVLWRGDGVAAYNLAVVVDDADQDVAEVVRGADLLDTTPRQILLGRLLGLGDRAYAHVPLVLGPDGERLAKRHGAVTLGDGWSAQEAVAWMAQSLGMAGEGERPSARELVERFDPGRLPREPAVLIRPS
jgi:glutamyl-tRNA synthetase